MRIRLLIAACSLALVPGVARAAGQARPLDSDVKLAYLLNFGRFVTWPAAGAGQQADRFTICVLGRDPFGAALDSAVSGEDVDGKPVAARRIESPADAAECRMLFISASEAPHVKEILRILDGSPTLTVSDIPQFVDQAGMIQFVPQGGRVRFTVNLDAAAHSGLAFSSELLRVAISVKTTAGRAGRR